MLDLFCGRWGWSKAFAARGWECFGVDLARSPAPKGCIFLEANVLEWNANMVCNLHPDFICGSSPCEQFSTMRNFRPPVPHPELGIKLFEHTRRICEESGVTYVMENVVGAQRFVGRSIAHCGSYYLWGTGVPPILPQGIRKGMTELAMGLREHKGKPNWNVRPGSKVEKQAAFTATIPLELANCVADYAERLMEVRA